jgi:hypothetical protein
MNKITIDELKEKLNYDDLRSVRRWCKNNNVIIIKQGKSEIVSEVNFEEAFDRPMINKLKSQFGKDWESAYRIFKNGNVPALNMLHDVPSVTYKVYKSDNEMYNKYHEKFKNRSKNKAA